MKRKTVETTYPTTLTPGEMKSRCPEILIAVLVDLGVDPEKYRDRLVWTRGDAHNEFCRMEVDIASRLGKIPARLIVCTDGNVTLQAELTPLASLMEGIIRRRAKSYLEKHLGAPRCG